ncbi:hypothetical protein GCM10027052_10940 [Parafrigoribacterium mesophilum]|uniref:hypothetical protein n=1 Tax=Parafrigoribacterium mesophilum TaxID=433646 RepID=UPI0031FBA6E0
MGIAGERLRAIRRVAVICIIVSLSVTALIGIATLLGGNFGDVQGRIMLTTLVIGTFGVLALADLAVAGRRFEWCGYVGILAGSVGLVMGLYLVWSDAEPSEAFWKSFGVATVLAASLAHANLLLLLGERRRPVVRTTLWITVGLITVLAGMIIALIATDGDIGTEIYARVLGTVAILDVLGTIVVPVISRFLRDESSPSSHAGLVVALPADLSGRLGTLAAERAMPTDAFVIKILEDLAGTHR